MAAKAWSVRSAVTISLPVTAPKRDVRKIHLQRPGFARRGDDGDFVVGAEALASIGQRAGPERKTEDTRRAIRLRLDLPGKSGHRPVAMPRRRWHQNRQGDQGDNGDNDGKNG